MSDIAGHARWWNIISRRVSEREMRRQILYSAVRKRVVRSNYVADYLADHVPVIVQEFAKMMTGAVIAFWIIGKLLGYMFHVSSFYIFPIFGLVFSMQATYYKYRLSVDRDYKIPRCRCAGRRIDNTETVLQSGRSTILGVPNSVLGSVFYSTLLVMAYLKHTDAAIPVALAAVAVSAYLSYEMVVKIGGLCANCINVGALNILILCRVLS